jgi:hypothetical protein
MKNILYAVVVTSMLLQGVALASEPDNIKNPQGFFARGYQAEWVSQSQAGTEDQFFAVMPCDLVAFSATFRNTGSNTWYNSGSDQVAFNIYKDPSVTSYPNSFTYQPLISESYFYNNSWLLPYRIGAISNSAVAPGQLGTVSMLFEVPCDASTGMYREDISMAAGQYWMYNPSNGDPLSVAHIWVGFSIQDLFGDEDFSSIEDMFNDLEW